MCTDLEDYERAYAQAGQVMSCLERFGTATNARFCPRTISGAGRLLLASADPGEVERFAHETLGPLLDGGDGHRRPGDAR